MTSNPIGIVICRVGAVILAVSFVRSLGFAIQPLLSDTGEVELLLMSALLTLAPLVAAFLLWIYAEQISALSWAQAAMFEDNDMIRDSVLSSTIGNRVSYVAQIVVGFSLLVLGRKNLGK